MWLIEGELRGLGFRRKSDRYWQCERRHGLPANAYLSLYPWSEHVAPDTSLRLIEFSSFHVTFRLETERIHFYYHEHQDDTWEPGGHTSTREILRVHDDPAALRARADEVAAVVVLGLGRVLRERRKKRREKS